MSSIGAPRANVNYGVLPSMMIKRFDKRVNKQRHSFVTDNPKYSILGS